jgi:hypothetical protein
VIWSGVHGASYSPVFFYKLAVSAMHSIIYYFLFPVPYSCLLPPGSYSHLPPTD